MRPQKAAGTTERGLTLALKTAALTRAARSAPRRSGQILGLLLSMGSLSLAVRGQYRSPWFGETRPPTKSGERGQSLGGWEWDGCLEAPVTEGARVLSLQVNPGDSGPLWAFHLHPSTPAPV